MTTTTGSVTQVDAIEVGSALAADAASATSTLIVESAAVFAQTGGTLLLDGAALVFTAADEATGVVTLVEDLLDDYEAGFPVLVTQAENKPLVEYQAQVQPDDPDASPLIAVLPTPILGRVSEGPLTTPVPVELGLVVGRWRVVRRLDGAATLDAPVRLSDAEGDVSGGVNDGGDVTARDLAYSGAFLADTETMLWDGVPAADMLDLLPKGVLSWGVRTPTVTGIGNNEYAIMALTVYSPRDCEAMLWLRGRLEGSDDNTRFKHRIRATFDADDPPTPATNASPVLTALDGSVSAEFVSQAPGLAGYDHGFTVSAPTQLAAGWHDLRWTVLTTAAGETVDTLAQWSLRVVDMGPVILGNAAYAPASPGTLETGGSDGGGSDPPEPQVYTRTYDATDTKWWDIEDSNTSRGDGPLQFGYPYIGSDQRAVIWFPKSTIVADLAGATVTGVELYLYVTSGKSAAELHKHTDTSPASDLYTNVSGIVSDYEATPQLIEGQGVWVPLDYHNDEWPTGGSIAGFELRAYPAPGGMWAKFRGAAQASRPQLRITYER